MTDATHSEAPVSEIDLAKKFARQEIAFDELPKVVRDKILGLSKDPLADLPDADPEPGPKDEGTAPEAKPSGTETDPGPEPAAKPEPKAKDGKKKFDNLDAAREELLLRANKINDLEQKHKAHEHRYVTDPVYRSKWNSEHGIPNTTEAPKAKPDVWSDDFHLTQAQRLEQLEARQAALDAREKAEATYGEFDQFAKKKLGHTFKTPLKELDRVVQMLEASGKTYTPEELKAVGFDGDDVQAYDTLQAVNKLKAEGNYPTLGGAYADWIDLNGGAPVHKKTEPGIADAESADRAKRKDKMEQVLAHATTLPNQRAIGAEMGITPEYAQRWLETHRNVDMYSDEDKATLKRIRTILGI